MTAVLLLVQEADAWQVIESDQFNGTDGSKPDSSMWGYVESDSNEVVKIEGNKLRCTVNTIGHAYVYNKNLCPLKNFTLLLDWQPKKIAARPIGIRLLSNDGAYVRDWLCLNYDGGGSYGWTVGRRTGGNWVAWYSYSNNVVVDTWYSVNITIKYDRFDITVKERSSGTVKFSRSDSFDALGSDNRWRIGTFNSVGSASPDAFFDNYLLYMIGKVQAPILTSPANNSLFNTTPTLRWSVGHITGWTFQSYHVQIDDDQNMGSPEVNTGTVSSSATSYTPPTLGEGKWYWRVRVENTSTIWSRWSNLRYFKIDLTPPTKPGAPSDAGVWSTSRTLVFTWPAANDASGVKGYYVRVGTSPNGTDKVLDAFTTGRTFSVTGCAENTTYYVSVAAKDNAGNVGAWSDPSNGITVDTTAPQATAVQDDGVFTNLTTLHFSWQPVAGDFSGVNAYLLYIGTTPANADVLNGKTTQDIAYNMSGALDGRTYYAWIRVRDNAGNLGPKGPASDGITVDRTPPTTPVVTDEGEFSVMAQNFSWTQSVDLVSGLHYYQVSIGTTPGGDDVERERIWSLQYFVMAGTDGETYYAKVRAVDRAGNVGQWSEPTDGITVDRTGPSGPDASDEGEWCTGPSTTFTWTASTDAVSGFSHYLVYVGTAPKQGDVVHDVVVQGQSFTISNLTEGTTYYCSVKGVDMVGNLGILGQPSDGITVDSKGPVAHMAYPTARWSTDGSMAWTWAMATDEVSGLAGYRLYVGTSPLGDDVVSGVGVNHTAIGYQLEGGLHGKTYYLRLEAIDVAGNVGPRTEASSPITVDLNVLRVSTVTDEGTWSTDPVLVFTWNPVTDDVSGVAGYRVFLGTSPDDMEDAGTVSANSSRITLMDSEDGSTYYFAVATFDVAGNVAELSPVTDGITVDMTAPSPVTPRDDGEWASGNVLAFEWDEPEGADLVDRTYVTIVTGTGSTVDTWELDGVVTAHELVGTVNGVTYHCRVAFRDEAGNVGPFGEASDGITVDLTAPTQVDVSPPPAIVLRGPIGFEWTTSEDAGSGVSMYEVYVGLDIDPHDATTTEGTTYTLMEPHGNSTYYCRVRAVDVAGNVGPWSPLHAGVYIYDGVPEVALEIEGGALMTSSVMVSLRLSYDDLMPAVDMRMSETEGMTGVDWETYTTSSTFYLQGRDGTHTVHVQVRNELGVVGEASASIILDTTAPAIVFVTKDGKATESDVITVRGTTEPTAILTHSGVQVPVAADGSFEVEVPLVMGNNIIELTAEDELGNWATASVVVKREPGSEWTPTTRGVSILLLVVVLVLVGVIAYIFTRGRRDEASEWTEMPEEPAP